MLTETEIKIRLNSSQHAAHILSRCTEMYGPPYKTNQRDEYFDTSDELLKLKDFTVRLRTVNSETKIALKGPRDFFADNIHTRLELEFSVRSYEEARLEIERQNLSATTTIEKRRYEFLTDDVHIAVDSLPFLGSFIEIEARSAQSITTTMTLLGLDSGLAVRENYTELLEQRLKELSLPVRPNLTATFELEHKMAGRDT